MIAADAPSSFVVATSKGTTTPVLLTSYPPTRVGMICSTALPFGKLVVRPLQQLPFLTQSKSARKNKSFLMAEREQIIQLSTFGTRLNPCSVPLELL